MSAFCWAPGSFGSACKNLMKLSVSVLKTKVLAFAVGGAEGGGGGRKHYPSRCSLFGLVMPNVGHLERIHFDFECHKLRIGLHHNKKMRMYISGIHEN